jgi:hypothetical protein
MTAADLASAARFEADSRERNYPGMVARQEITAAEATEDYQAWVTIADWLETGRFVSGNIEAGDGARADLSDIRTVVDWLLCEQAADRAVVSTLAAFREAQAAVAGTGDQAKAFSLGVRLDGLRAIARKVSRMRADVEALNRAFRGARQQQRAAA